MHIQSLFERMVQKRETSKTERNVLLMVEFQVLEVGSLGPQLGTSCTRPRVAPGHSLLCLWEDQLCQLCLIPGVGWGTIEGSVSCECDPGSVTELSEVSPFHRKKKKNNPNVRWSQFCPQRGGRGCADK